MVAPRSRTLSSCITAALACLMPAAALFSTGCTPSSSPLRELVYDLWSGGGGALAADPEPSDGSQTEPGPAAGSEPPYEVQTDGGPAGGETAVEGEIALRDGEPLLEVSVDALDFGDTTTQLAFEVHNAGGGAMAYVVEADVAWLSLSPESGVNEGTYDEIAAQIEREGLAAGPYSGQVTVAAADGQQQHVAVWMVVPTSPDSPPAIPDLPPPGGGSQPPATSPVLEISTEQLHFGPTDNQLTFTLHNAGDGAFQYWIQSGAQWVGIEPSYGVVTTNIDTLTVHVNRDFLVTGSHSAELAILTDAGEMATVSITAIKRVTSPRILPCFEVAPRARVADLVASLAIWRRVTDTAIVVLYPGCVSWYAEILEQVPDMTIIPGIKTHPILGSGENTYFESPEGWQTIAVEAAAIAAATGQSRIFLEHETALNAYWAGTYQINMDALQQSLACMPENLDVIWYPGIPWCNTPQLLAKGVTLCETVNDVLNVQFLDHSWGHPLWPTFQDWIEARTALEQLSASPPIPLCWFTCAPDPNGDPFCFWTSEQAHEAMDQLVGYAEMIIAPGLPPWIEITEGITTDLAQHDGAWK